MKLKGAEEVTVPDYVEALKTGEIKDGEMKGVFIRGRRLLLARVGGNFYAASGVCPHMKGWLPGGKLNGTVVTCPRHASQFDLKDGHVIRWTNWSGLMLAVARLFRPPRPLPTYPVKIDGDRVLVEL